MDVRFGLSLLLLLCHMTGTISKNTRDGPKIRPQQFKRAAAPSEFLVPPPPIFERPSYPMPPRDLAPPRPPVPPLPPSSQRTRGPLPNRHGRHLNPSHPTPESPGYFSKLMGWLNPFGSGTNGGNGPPSKYGPPNFPPPPNHPQQPQAPISNYQHKSPNHLPRSPNGNSHDSTYFGRVPPFQPGKSCNPCNQVPWIPINGNAIPPIPQYPPISNHNPSENPGYLPPPIHPPPQPDFPLQPPPDFAHQPQPDYPYEPPPNFPHQPPPDFPFPSSDYPDVHDGPAVFPHLHPYVPPLYKAKNFQPSFGHGGFERLATSGTSEVHHEVLPESKSSEDANKSKTVIRESPIGGRLDANKPKVYKKTVHEPEVVPALGTEVSTEIVHYEQSPVIDLSSQSQFVTDNRHVKPLHSEPVNVKPSLIDYIVSGYEDKSATTVRAHLLIRDLEKSDLEDRQENQNSESIRETKDTFKRFNTDFYSEDVYRDFLPAENDTSAEASIEILATPVYPKSGKKRNKQVQIIIPYTSQHTPSPFNSVQDNNGHGSGDSSFNQIEKSSSLHTNKADDNVVGQESQNIQVTHLPDPSFQSNRLSGSASKNNSIDVQRLQKNIDNWTIEEYLSGTTTSSVSYNSTRPYLSPSKKIPNEYLTTAEPNETEEVESVNDVDSNVTNEPTVTVVSNNTEEVKVMTEGVAETNLPPQDTENSTRVTIVKGRPWSRSEMDQLWQRLPSSTTDKESVFVVTSRTLSTTEHAETQEKKKQVLLGVELKKKPKKKKKSYEPVERAYQVLPQAVNNLAMVSTGPENLPLWGIMEHEEFASSSPPSESTETQSPVLYSGHSKVSRANR